MKYKYRAIYSIENGINNKIYIGSSIDVFNRWEDHKKLLRKGIHENPRLQHDWTKYGEQIFRFFIIECVSETINLRDREQYYLDRYSAYEQILGYNICVKAGTTYGVPRSTETRNKLSNSLKGRKLSELHKLAISRGLKGRVVTQETRNKIAKSNTGKKASIEHRQKLSDAHKAPVDFNFIINPIEWKK